MITNNTLSTIINSTVRTVTGKVEMYEGTTLIQTFAHTDKLIEFTIERVGEEKFFGFGVCQKINVKLLDLHREITVTTANSFKLYFNNVNTSPIFYVTEVNRDENTNELSITAYDIINKATNHKVSELTLTAPYTIRDFANACSGLLGLGAVVFPTNSSAFDLSYTDGANFEGTENIRETLNSIAEATQTVYYINQSNQLVFKQLDKDGEPVYIIDKSRYFELDSKTNRRLTKLTHATELGDNVSSELEQTGTTQYIRNNPFWDLREDIGTIVQNALDRIGGLTINQFECEWRGNPLLEVGDKIALTTKDDDAVISYIINDVITYNGSLVEESQWHYTDDEGTEDNPATLGDALKYTYARVDKVNKEIVLMASDVAENNKKVAAIEVALDGIDLTVLSEVTEVVNGMQDQIDDVDNKVDGFDDRINANSSNIVQITEKMSSIELDIDSIDLTISETQTSINEIDGVVQQHTEKLAQIDLDLDSIDLKVTEANQSVNEMDGKVDEITEKMSAIEIDLDSIDLTISEVSTTVDEHTEKLAQIDLDLDSIDLSVSEVKTDVDDHSEKLAQIGIDLDSITLEVSRVEQKVENIEGVNVEVGARNLLKHSKLLSESYAFGDSDAGDVTVSNSNRWTVGDTDDGFKQFEVINPASSGYRITEYRYMTIPLYTSYANLTSNTVTVSFEYYNDNPSASNLGFTFGCFEKIHDIGDFSGNRYGSGACIMMNWGEEYGDLETFVIYKNCYVSGNFMPVSNMKVLSTNGDWTRVSYTFDPNPINTGVVVDSTSSNNSYTIEDYSMFEYRLLFKVGKESGDYNVYIRKPKFEIGNIATDWSPAVEDVEGEIGKVEETVIVHETKIEQNAESITLSASRTEANEQAISSLQINADSISSSVKEIETVTTTAIDGITEELATLTKSVETKTTSEDVSILVKQELSNGVSSVTTETGFTFNQEGLTISKSDSEMSTLVDEDGLTIYKNDDEVMLDVSNVGVDAQNINVRTYLIIGRNSRFEDYGDNRTGCFFIGQTTTTTSEE